MPITDKKCQNLYGELAAFIDAAGMIEDRDTVAILSQLLGRVTALLAVNHVREEMERTRDKDKALAGVVNFEKELLLEIITNVRHARSEALDAFTEFSREKHGGKGG